MTDQRRVEEFEHWARVAHTRLARLAWMLTGDRGHGEDLVQDTMWRMYRSWRRIDSPHAIDAYARTTMIRLAQRRRARRWNGEYTTEPDRLDVLSSESATARVNDADALGRALAELPNEQRVVLVLRYYEDCSEAEIAKTLGCAPGTVKSRAARGLAALRADPSLGEITEQARQDQ